MRKSQHNLIPSSIGSSPIEAHAQKSAQQQIVPANAGKAFRFQADVLGPAWLHSALAKNRCVIR
jgi:hypothetical protein